MQLTEMFFITENVVKVNVRALESNKGSILKTAKKLKIISLSYCKQKNCTKN
jgi:hypothetical protein